ncbi:MAG: signal recognition particle-docking protein FtsY [Thermoproteota archaeon]|nr:signal recognition particle-docking protein FtsY [Thermoproteota archaeon]
MFDKLKKAFSDVAKNLGQREISEKDLDKILEELLFSLIESDVAEQVALSVIERMKSHLMENRLEKNIDSGQVVKSRLFVMLKDLFEASGRRDIIQEVIDKKKSKLGPYVIVFLGINGTGKTTTVAKFSSLLHKRGLSVVMAAADTHRAGAIEQLSQHGANLGIKVISQRYGADPSAVARDAIDHARKNYIDAVLVDTAGRMQTSKNLMEEVSKIMRVIKPDAKIFVGDSLAGNDTVSQAKEFFHYTNFDGAILTKSDADSKGGAAISIVQLTAKPIVYLGIGQKYDDLVEFDSEQFMRSILGEVHLDYTGNSHHKSVEKIISGRSSTDDDIAENDSNPRSVRPVPIESLASEEMSLSKKEKGAELVKPIETHKEPNLQNKTSQNIMPNSDDMTSVNEKPKNKGFLSGLLRRGRRENSSDGAVEEGDKERKDHPKEKERSTGKDEVVYLSDDDINDLIE